MKKYFTGLTKNSFLLAFNSFFADVATEMLYPVLPIFLTQVLLAPVALVGVIEGIAEATQNIVQGFSGRIADKLQNNKKIALFGYGLAALAKPFMGLAGNWQHFLVGRALDRLGTGTRSAPRDALIASSVKEKYKGKAFGIEGLGDNLGAVVGPLLALLLLFIFHLQIRLIFFLAFIPGLIAFLMILSVTQKPRQQIMSYKFSLTNLPTSYWKYLFAVGVAGIGNSSNAFLILRAKHIGIATETTILIYAAFNLMAALSSYPAGSLSDRLGRRNIIILALFIFTLTYFGFALSRNFLLIGLLFILYGAYQGIFRAVGKALATDLVPRHLRATGIGIYSTVIGLTSLVASIVGGQLWDKINPSAVFLFGAIMAILGGISLLVLVPKKIVLV